MGYDWTMTDYSLRIEAKKFAALREAVRSQTSGDLSGFDELTENAGRPEISDKTIVTQLFSDFSFETGYDPKTGALVEIYQQGSRLGDEDKLMALIAPFCDEGDYIGGRGEGGELWRWVLSPKHGMYEEEGLVFYTRTTGTCPMKEIIEVCTACPFALICSTSDSTILNSARCSNCGGDVLYKDKGNNTGPIAGLTCTCLERKFNVDKTTEVSGV